MNFLEEPQHRDDPTWGNQLQYFNITKNINFTYESSGEGIWNHASKKQKELRRLHGQIRKIDRYSKRAFRWYQKISSWFFNKNGLYLQRAGYAKNYSCDKSDIFIEGVYECSKYFAGIEHILQNEFTPVNQPLKKNALLYDRIRNNDSVCVSVRRGDFLSEANRNLYNVCTKKYFEKAIEKMESLHPGVVFCFFSDDIEWCKETFKDSSSKYFFESGDDPVWEKIRLMYSCKHFIISNSTFSWWAQFLCRNTDKTVIVPERWFNERGFKHPLIEKEFIKIPVD